MNNKPFRRGNPFLQDIQNAQHKMVIEMSLLDLYIGDKECLKASTIISLPVIVNLMLINES